MPSEVLSLALTSGLGFGVVAGIVSGVCYILVHGIQRRGRNSRRGSSWKCDVCDGTFRSIDGILDTDKVVSCSRCCGRVCKVRCSTKNSAKLWTCSNCQEPETWFRGILTALQPNSLKVQNSQRTMDEIVSEVDADLKKLRDREKEQVRDFIERLVSAMLGGELDDTNVTRIYDDNKYLPITGQSPCSAHATLKQIIQKIIRDASELPELREATKSPAQSLNSIPLETESTRTYEDLLATAILNKVITSYQEELPRSSAGSVSSRTSRVSKPSSSSGKEYFFGEETLESKWKNGSGHTDQDTTSISSLEEWIRSGDTSGPKHVNQMTLTIQQRIEEVSSSEDDCESVYSRLSTARNSKKKASEDESDWSENWVLQKRKYNGTASPVPVPMLVPNPSIICKVQIGDKDVEDTSDLSETGSDFGDTESYSDIKNILVDSRTVIGGKNALNSFVDNNDGDATAEEEDDDTTDVDVAEVKSNGTDFLSNDSESVEINEAKNVALLADAYLEHSSLESNTEQDAEYTEKYATLPRTIFKSPVAKPRNLENYIQRKDSSPDPAEDSGIDAKENSDNMSKDQDQDGDSDKDDDFMELFKGSYSEREKKKWENPVPLPNNPYSPENLDRRLSRNSSFSSTSSSIFGRDYYIREAAKSTGARKPEKLAENSLSPPTSPVVEDDITPKKPLPKTRTSLPKQDLQDELITNTFEIVRNSSIDDLTSILKTFEVKEVVVKENIHEDNRREISIKDFVFTSSTPVKKDIDAKLIQRPTQLDLSDDSDVPPPIPITPVPTPDKKSYDFLGQTDELLYRAFPILVEGDTVNFFTDTEESSMDCSMNSRPKSLNLSDSDEAMSLERVYNLQTGTIIEKVGNISREIIIGSKSPEGLKYVTKIEDSGSITISSPIDENHNDVMAKREFMNQLYKSEMDINVVEDQIDSMHEKLLEVPFNFKDDVVEDANGTNTIVCNNMQFSLQENNQTIADRIMENLNFNINPARVTYDDDDDDANTIKNFQEFSLERSDMGDDAELNSLAGSTNSSTDKEVEINELKDKAIVKKYLGEFVKLKPNGCDESATKSSDMSGTDSQWSAEIGVNDDSDDETCQEFTSVQELKKIFLAKEAKNKPSQINGLAKASPRQIHSLTARSLSKEFRQELKVGNEIVEKKSKKSIVETFGFSDTNSDVASEEDNRVNTKNIIAHYEKLRASYK